MADLTPFVFQGQFPRSRAGRAGAGGAGQLPAQSPGGVQAGAEAIGGFGDALGRVGAIVSQIDTRFAQAQAANQSVEAINTTLDAMEAMALALQDDPTVQPMDKAGVFTERFDQELQQTADTLPLLARAPYLRTVGNARRQFTRGLTDLGRKQTHARGMAMFTALSDRLQTGLSNTTTDAEEQELLLSLHDLGAQYVGLNIFSREEMGAKLQEIEQEAVASRLRILTQLAPDQAMDVLKDDGHADTRRLAPGQREVLLDKAQQEMDGHLQREEATAMRSERQTKKQQDQVAQTYATRLASPALTFEGLRAIQSGINNDSDKRRLGLQHQTALSRWVQAQWTAKQSSDAAGDAQLAQLTGMALEMARSPAQVSRVEAYITSRALDLGERLTPLLARVNVRRDATSMTNQDAYHEGLRIIKEAAGVVDDVTLISITQQATTDPKMAKLARTIDIYRQTMEPIYNSPNGFIEGNQRAELEARALSELYFPFDPTQGLPPSLQRFLIFENAEEFKAQQRSLGGAQLSLELKLEVKRAMEAKWNALQ